MFISSKDLTESVLLESINELLNNSTYRERAQAIGDLVITIKLNFVIAEIKCFINGLKQKKFYGL